jgi:pyruvate,water dikinase
VGLLRRAVLEVGRRGVAAGFLTTDLHALELTLEEVLAVADGEPGPGAAVAARRATDRVELGTATPPASLGSEPPAPPLHLFPKHLAAVADMAMTCVEHLEKGKPTADRGELAGLGVGSEPYTGRARVAHSADEALALMEPGDVLVVPFTTPAYNAVLAIAGGLVTEEGGALSHAAVLARELDLPSVIGAPGVMSAITDGATVTVDPTKGEVTNQRL